MFQPMSGVANAIRVECSLALPIFSYPLGAFRCTTEGDNPSCTELVRYETCSKIGAVNRADMSSD
jgi:hypothetical protein